jgi:Domain of unknown function (DUF4062)
MLKTIFVSSTFVDLAGHRRAVWELLESRKLAVRGMEQFGARPETPLATCIAELEQSDIYIGIVAFRLGSIEQSSGKSFTQLEYERAQELQKPTLIYVIDEENALVNVKFVDQGESREKLDAFKRTLRERHTVDSFLDDKNLVKKIGRDLERLLGTTADVEINADEVAEVTADLKRFLLAPKTLSGHEVKLEIRTTSAPFPASRAVCDAFNLEFGATVGANVQITQPTFNGLHEISELYMTAKQATELAPFSTSARYLIHARLQFSPSPIKEVTARYRTYSETSFANTAMALAQGTTTFRIEADAKIALALSRVADRLTDAQ